MLDVHLSNEGIELARLAEYARAGAAFRSAGARYRAAVEAREFARGNSLRHATRPHLSRSARDSFPGTAASIARAAGPVHVDSGSDLDCGDRVCVGQPESHSAQPCLRLQRRVRNHADTEARAG